MGYYELPIGKGHRLHYGPLDRADRRLDPGQP